MRRLSLAGLSLPLLIGCGTDEASQPDAGENREAKRAAAEEVQTSVTAGATLAWRPAVGKPPAGWTGPVFALSRGYPTQLPGPPEGGYPWDPIDPTTQPRSYMQAVLDYARADLEAVDWDPTKLERPNWFHAPWMATGRPRDSGREFIHGLTRERWSRSGELSPKQTNDYIPNYAVGLYNDVGGFTFGQVWANPSAPDLRQGKAKFRDGAVAIKLLFTKANPDVEGDGVPYLVGSKEWQANIAPFRSDNREPDTLRLLQVDIAVRDRDATTTGWLFGTFVYNGYADGETPLDRLEPVGLMWGDSPGFLPAKVDQGELPPEQWINDDVGTYQHYGWAKRVNGPVDNPRSSCMSCHGHSAAWPPPEQMVPPSNLSDIQKLPWFENVLAGQTSLPGSVSLDYSLQMAVGLEAWERSSIGRLASGDAARAGQSHRQISREEDPRRR